MSVQGVADECGLSLAEARLAKLRDYDEPFRVLSPDPSARSRLCRALRSAGLRCFSGGRFDHVTSGANKGLAAGFLRRSYEHEWAEVASVGLGDDANDVEMLKAVDVPVIVRQTNADVTARMAERVRGARVTSAVGPAGWSEAIMAVLDRFGVGGVAAGETREARRA
jgi:mannosyl-3-phosphoglycerate phosphatase